MKIQNWIALSVLFLGVGVPTQATVIPLLGGDPADGWIAPVPTNVVYAGDAYADYGVPPGPIQGVTFSSFRTDGYGGSVPPTGWSLTGASAWSDTTGPLFASPNASGTDDQKMSYLLKSWYYGQMTLTMANLSPLGKYRLDLFVWSPGTEDQTITITGDGTPIVETLAISPAGSSYVITNQVTANSLGNLVVTFADNTSVNPRFSGFVLSVPEPTMAVCAALAGITLAALKRRRS